MMPTLELTFLHCTGELRTAMTAGGFRLNLQDEKSASSDHWYAHLLSINKRHCVLFCHVATRYSLVAIALAPARLRALKMAFADALQQTLAEEPISAEAVSELRQYWQAIAYARAPEQAMLAHMNESARLLRLSISEHGGLLICPIEKIVYQLNRRTLDPATPSDTPVRRFGLRFGLELDDEEPTSTRKPIVS